LPDLEISPWSLMPGTGAWLLPSLRTIALAELLDIPSSPKTGGVDGDIVYVVFPGSGDGQPRTALEIDREGERAFHQWGGLSRLAACYPEYEWDKNILTIARPK
jgi:hypothetical protein